MIVLGLMISPFIHADDTAGAYVAQTPKRKGVRAQAVGCSADGLWAVMRLTDLLI
jgi:hypothetical protein